MVRCKIIRQRRYRRRMKRRIKRQLVASGKHLHDKAAVQIMSGEALRVDGDAVEFNNLHSPSHTMSMCGGSDSGKKGNKWSREDKILFDLSYHSYFTTKSNAATSAGNGAANKQFDIFS